MLAGQAGGAVEGRPRLNTDTSVHLQWSWEVTKLPFTQVLGGQVFASVSPLWGGQMMALQPGGG